MKVIEVVGAFLQKGEQFLLFQRHQSRPQPLQWCLPSGKIEAGESIHQAMLRELQEETGQLFQLEQLNYLYSKTYDFSADGYNINYHVFKVVVPKSFTSVIEPEAHIDQRWLSAEEALKMPGLITGLDDVIQRVYRKK